MQDNMDYQLVKSDKLLKQMEEAKNAPFKEGEDITIPTKYLYQFVNNDKDTKYATILSINDGVALVKYDRNSTKYVNTEHCKHILNNVGANPFNDINWRGITRDVAYSLESVIFECIKDKDQYFKTPVENINWNPYIFDKDGNKMYYQRDFVWSLEDKQLLIDSIYNYIDCGRIVVRLHSFEDVKENHNNGDGTMAWKDIVDGKQRLHTILEFINNEFPDKQGNYYKDLSMKARYHLTDHRLFSYCEMDEEATDEDVLRTFLMVNFSGRPMSQEHLDYVKDLYTKIK